MRTTNARCRFALSAAVLLSAAAAPSADASVASDVQAELSAFGISAEVTVAAPAAAAGPLTDDPVAEPSDVPSFASMKAYLSPDPTAPLPVVTVRMALPFGDRLAGLLGELPPEVGSTATPRLLESELAVFETIKHALAKGATLVGFELIIEFPGHDETVEILQATPDVGIYEPRQLFSALMPRSELEAAAVAGLPDWARQIAELTVTDDPVGERILTVSLDLPRWAFAAVRATELSSALDATQIERAADGANIGRTIVRVGDSMSGDPLYVSANDALFGYRSEWHSPLVLALSHQATNSATAPIDSVLSQAWPSEDSDPPSLDSIPPGIN